MKFTPSFWILNALCLIGMSALPLPSQAAQSNNSTSTSATRTRTSPAAAEIPDGKSTPSVTSPAAGDAGIAEPTPLVHTGASTFGEQTDPSVIDTPPPPARAETKPASPDPKYAWVAGHYIPVKGEWQWVAGKWAMPPTVESVWIQGSYDAKTKRWSEGHWQPDGKPATKPELNEKGPAPDKK
jgi:hypothetical protein